MVCVSHLHLKKHFDSKSEHLMDCVRFDVFTAVLLKIQIFWDVTLCCWVIVSSFLERNLVPSSSSVEGPYPSTTGDQGILI
jgi:hypothetical protein